MLIWFLVIVWFKNIKNIKTIDPKIFNPKLLRNQTRNHMEVLRYITSTTRNINVGIDIYQSKKVSFFNQEKQIKIRPVPAPF